MLTLDPARGRDRLILRFGRIALALAAGAGAALAHPPFGFLAGLPDQTLAGFLRQWRHGHANHLAGGSRVQPQVGIDDGPLDVPHQALVEGRDGQHPGVGHRHVGNLAQGCGAPVILDHDAIQHTGVCPSGAQPAQGRRQGIQRLVHALGCVGLEFFDHVNALPPGCLRSPP